MKNKTAVEWLIEQINQKSFEIDNGYPIITIEDVNELALQAIELEKQQIMQAYNFGQQIPPFDYAEQYYSETYKKPTE